MYDKYTEEARWQSQFDRAQREYDNQTDEREEYVDLTDEEADELDSFEPDWDDLADEREFDEWE